MSLPADQAPTLRTLAVVGFDSPQRLKLLSPMDWLCVSEARICCSTQHESAAWETSPSGEGSAFTRRRARFDSEVSYHARLAQLPEAADLNPAKSRLKSEGAHRPPAAGAETGPYKPG